MPPAKQSRQSDEHRDPENPGAARSRQAGRWRGPSGVGTRPGANRLTWHVPTAKIDPRTPPDPDSCPKRSMTPEQQARQRIDRLLAQSGWVVQDYKDLDLAAGLGVAVREFPLETGSADYLLYADARAVGVVEAKPEGH